jgi:tetratricopeptide (TPR) repeat protein
MNWFFLSILLCYPLVTLGTGDIQEIEELTLLPDYCKGTQVTRSISGDTRPYSEYIAAYGATYIHMHHYCWALNAENKLSQIREKHHKLSELNSILDNIQYVLNRAPQNFPLLPEIYLSKARILFKLERDVEAVKVLFKLTRIRPEYSPTYAQLGDYYQRIGDKVNAIKTYEWGLINSHGKNTTFFLNKIIKLDNSYHPPPTTKRTVNQPDTIPDLPASAASAAPPPPLANQPDKPNPYCRFCP